MLFALAEEQHGAFTTAQAAELGIDGHALARARRDRLIDRIHSGVHAVLALIDDWTSMAAIQLAQPRAVAGYRAGAKLQRFDGVEVIAMDVLVPPKVWLRGATVHHVTDLVVPEIVVIDGIRCTDEVRTLIDYASLVDDDTLERAMESVFRRAPTARGLLVDRATALARPGKSGPAIWTSSSSSSSTATAATAAWRRSSGIATARTTSSASTGCPCGSPTRTCGTTAVAPR